MAKMTIEQIKAKMATLDENSRDYRAFAAVLRDRETTPETRGPFAGMGSHTEWSDDPETRKKQEVKVFRALHMGD